MSAYEAEDFSFERIEAMIAANHRWRVESCRRIPTGKYNVTYEVTVDADGRCDTPPSVILRIAPPDDAGGTFYEIGMMAQEPEIHAIVRRETGIPVAEIYTYDTSRRIVDRDFLIMEKLPGQALSLIPRLTPAFYHGVLEQVGRMLAELHGITRDRYGYLGAHRCMEPQPDWPSAFRIMWNRLIDDIVAAGAYAEHEAALLRNLHETFRGCFERPVAASLLHMDIWGQNILVDAQGRVTGLVDWDRGLWGDPEIEFAVLDYCGISEPAFWEGYGRPRDRSAEAQVRGLFYLLYEMQKYIVIEIVRRDNRRAALGHKARVFHLVQNALR